MTVMKEDFGFRRGAQLPGDCVLAHRKHLCHVGAAQDHDADQTNAKVAALDKDGRLQLKLQRQTLVTHLWRKRDPAKVAREQLEFAIRSKQQRKARSYRLVAVLFALAHLVGAQSCRPH